jgi:hypothetical protein
MKTVCISEELDKITKKYGGTGRDYEYRQISKNIQEIVNLAIYDKRGKDIVFIPKFLKFDIRKTVPTKVRGDKGYVYMMNGGRLGVSKYKGALKKRGPIKDH